MEMPIFGGWILLAVLLLVLCGLSRLYMKAPKIAMAAGLIVAIVLLIVVLLI